MITNYKAELQSDKMKNILLSTVDLKVVKLELPAGEMLAEHHSDRSVVAVCIKGNGIFTIGTKQQELSSGDIIYMEPYENHSVKATTDLVLVVNQMNLANSQTKNENKS